MPFKSESQRRLFWAKADSGEISKKIVEEWQAATPKGKKLPDHVKKHASLAKYALNAVQKGVIIGGGLGTALGGYIGYKHPEDKKHRMRSTIGNAISMGVTGGYLGGQVGRLKMIHNYYRDPSSWQHSYRYGGGGARPSWGGGPVKKPSWVGKATTKAEAKSAFRQEAMKHHPDRGGSEEAMKNLNTEWDRFTQSPMYEKMAAAFMDEFTKISNLANLGGLVASQLARSQVAPSVSEAVGNLEDDIARRWYEFSRQDQS